MHSTILIKITGKNVSNYLKWLITNKINYTNLNIVKPNEIQFIINSKDLSKLKKYSPTYKIAIIKKYGKIKIIEIIKNNLIVIIAIIFSILLIFGLSKVIFSVDIIYNDQEIIDNIEEELNKYGIKKYHLKKNYRYLEKVKKKILNDNSDYLEWLEIEESGTKYIVRIVERKKETSKKDNTYQSITAKKDSIILSIDAYAGEKVKNLNEYVKAGEEIITGKLLKPDSTIYYEKAQGKVLGEVWYKVDIEYPLYYYEEKTTGKNKTAIMIKFLNKDIPVIPNKKYRKFKPYNKIIFKSNIIPFEILKVRMYEINTKESIYTPESATKSAIELVKHKMLEKNQDITEIKDIIILNNSIKSSKIKLTLFASVIENITNITPITEEEIS